MTENKQNDEQWREKLSPEQFNVCRKKGTEAPFSGKYVDCKTKGVYRCVCCGTPLVRSDSKYDSGSGWPSFWEVFSNDSVAQVVDSTHGMRRVEVACKSCGAHLGHVFDDGPQPTGLRYCINSVALEMEENE